MIQHLKTWWTAHVAWIALAASFLAPSFQQYISDHPKSFIGGVLALVLVALKTNVKGFTTAAKIIIAALFLSIPAHAQTQTFSLTAQPVAIPTGSGQAKQTVAAAITGATLTVTRNFDLRNDDVITSDGNLQGYYGGFNYRLPVLSTALNNMSPNLNGYNFRFYLTGSVGQDHIAALGGSVNSHWSFLAGIGCDYKMTGSGSWTIGFEARYAKLPGYANNTALLSLPLTFHF